MLTISSIVFHVTIASTTLLLSVHCPACIRMALTLISHEKSIRQEACLNFGVEDYDDDEEHPEQNRFFGINIKTCKILVEPLGQHGLFMVVLFLSG